MAGGFSKEKFKELVLYIAAKSLADPHFARTKLAAILFYSDFAAYGQLGAAITGAMYRKFPSGPFPMSLYEAEQALSAENAARVDRVSSFIRPRERLVPLRAPKLAHFTAEEIAIVDAVLDELRPYTAQQTVALSLP